MSLAQIPIVHAILDAKPLGVEIQKHYHFAEPFHCELLVRGMNDVYLIRTGGERFAARCYRHDGMPEAKVAYEVAFLAHLDRAGVPVPAPISTTNGTLHFMVGGPEGPRAVAVFRYIEGNVLFQNPTPVPHARRLGEYLARIHLAGRDFHFEPRRVIDRAGLIRNGIEDLVWLCSDRPEDAQYYPRASVAVADALDALDPKAMPYGPCHGDVHAHNAFVDDRGRLTVMDFESCGEDFWAAELISFTWAGRKNRLPEDVIAAFHDGYDSERPRSAAERACEPLQGNSYSSPAPCAQHRASTARRED
ncbi:MAG: hypothetical protein FJX65_19210 [Alphaproteobacteria bacterium]|nr:hypothetical protein [Alphaproteobacteria bacterium]